jgi:hypothetical protein
MGITVTVLDAAGIQGFIFASNVLRENIGASELVHRATRQWAFEELLHELSVRGVPKNHNVDLEKAKQDQVRAMLNGEFQVGKDPGQAGAEVVYAGGGNTVILFQAQDSGELAKDFVFRLSQRILRDAPGLNLYAAHSSYDWGADELALSTVVTNTINLLGSIKGKEPGSLPTLSKSVTATCTSTGLPANDTHPDLKGKTGSASRANRQVVAKWNAAEVATERLKAMFPQVGTMGFDWTDNFDTLATLPDRNDSYIAVVHADGNGMGAKISRVTEEWAKHPTNPRGYIDHMRDLSCRVQETAHAALMLTFDALGDYLRRNDWDKPKKHSYKEERHWFPVRPIVFGGDDVTLVCAGPWGLAVAQSYLNNLEHQTLAKDHSEPPYACAGVAIVKTHYPFSQAYALSGQLADGAKKRAGYIAKKKASVLDWHVSTTGLAGSLETIRQREYMVQHGCLVMRPVVLRDDYPGAIPTWRTWGNVSGLMSVFGEHGDWQDRRNKIMRLREALRLGPEAVSEFMKIYGEKESEIIRRTQFDAKSGLENGWVSVNAECEDANGNELARCAYFDAIEIADQYFDLESDRDGVA